MILTVRFYASEEQANQTAASLQEEGFGASTIYVVSPGDGTPAETVAAAVKSGQLPSSYKTVATQALAAGNHAVSVETPFGHGVVAERVMNDSGPVDAIDLPPPSFHDPAPLSNLFGIPVLSSQTRSRTRLRRSDSYSWPNWFGLGLTSKNPTPLSSMTGIPLLKKGPGNSSFFLPLLSSNPTPLSSLFGLNTLSSTKDNWTQSFGFSLLSDDPAPLSNMLGMPTITKRDD